MIALRKKEHTTPGVGNGSTETPRPFLAFAIDEMTAEIVREVAELRGYSIDGVVVGDLDDAVDGLANIRTPEILIVDLGPAPDIMVEAERLAQVCDPEARVILLGEVNDLHIYRDLIAAGVADYVIKPFDTMALGAAVDRARPAVAEISKAVDKAVSTDAVADVVAVIGARGGVGTSTIAANVASFASTRHEKSVVLIDMDLTFGTQALILDIDPSNGLGDAMLEPGRMDELFVKRALVTLSDKFRVMAAETDPAKGDIASAEAFAGLLDYVRSEVDLVVVDIPRSVVVSQPAILESLNRVVLVADPGLAAMRDTARLVTTIKSVNPLAEVTVILNRQGIAPKHELTRKVFEDGARIKVNAVLPFDAKTALGADAQGKCVMQTAARSKLAKGLRKVADMAIGIEAVPVSAGLFGKLKAKRKAAGMAEKGAR